MHALSSFDWPGSFYDAVNMVLPALREDVPDHGRRYAMTIITSMIGLSRLSNLRWMMLCFVVF
jgi:hypothetical protein